MEHIRMIKLVKSPPRFKKVLQAPGIVMYYCSGFDFSAKSGNKANRFKKFNLPSFHCGTFGKFASKSVKREYSNRLRL